MFQFFTSRRRIQKIARYASELASGKESLPPRDTSEPFRTLISCIELLASKSVEDSRIAVEESNKLNAIIESMAEGVFVADVDQKVVLLNSSLASAFGFDKKTAIGRFYWEVFRDAGVNEMITQALKDRSAVRKEQEVLFSKNIFEVQVAPVFTSRDFLGVVAVFRDITLLKEFERLRSEFVANVSHELKTPLTSILGFVETLKEGAIEDAEHRLKFLQIIEMQSKHLHSLIEDLLLLSRVESSSEPLRIQEVCLDELFKKINDTFTPFLKEKKMTLQISPGEKPVFLNADPVFLERAVSNLVDNAIKYSKPNGTVWLAGQEEKDWVRIEVRDEGIGIIASDLARIFERFYRSDKSRAREHGGTGLGLSITKHLIERHGGKIEVQSIPEQGSVFTLVLQKAFAGKTT